MTGMEVYVAVALLIFAWLCFIWKSGDYVNAFFKFVFACMAAWALYLTIENHLQVQSDNLKAERIKLEQLQKSISSTNSVTSIEK